MAVRASTDWVKAHSPGTDNADVRCPSGHRCLAGARGSRRRRLGVGIAYEVPGAEGLAYPLDAFVNVLVVVAVVVLLGACCGPGPGSWWRHLP